MECSEGQTDRLTDTQTAVANTHFASATPHAKCNNKPDNNLIYNVHIMLRKSRIGGAKAMLTDIRPHEGFFYYAIGVYTSKRQESLLLGFLSFIERFHGIRTKINVSLHYV